MSHKGLLALIILTMVLLVPGPAGPADPTNAAEGKASGALPETAGKAPGAPDPGKGEQPVQGARVTEGKAKGPESPGDQAPPGTASTDAGTVGNVKAPVESGVTNEPVKPETGRKSRLLDRRWISELSEPKRSGTTKIPVQEQTPFPWENETQKSQCESYLRQLRENFIHARFYSIQGDPCKTAQYAGFYLGLVTICRSRCPEEFLERSGHSKKIIRNLSRLQTLGKEDCLGPK